MANTLRFKRGLVAGIPTGVAGEPLFTTDTFDLYIGNGTTNTRFQKYIASGTTAQYLRGDGSLATFPTNIVTGTGTTNYLPKFTGASTLGNSLLQEGTNAIGLAVSPSAWTVVKAFQNQRSTFSSYWDSVFASTQISTNAYYDGSWRYIESYGAAKYDQQTDNKAHFWTTAPAGTAGNAITFTQAMTLYSTGNLAIGSAAADTGQRLQVTGDTLLKGSGNTSATNALLVQNSDSTVLFRIKNEGGFNLSGSNGLFFSMFTTSGGTPSISGTNTQFYNYTTTQAATSGAFLFTGDNFQQTSGAVHTLIITKGFIPTSGTASFSNLTIAPTINQTGGANGITRGLYVVPSLTAAADWRSIETSNNSGWSYYGAGTANSYFGGSVGIGTTSLTGYSLVVGKNITGSASSYAISQSGIVQTDVTANAGGFINFMNTVASANVTSYYHFRGLESTIGAGTTVANQFGFHIADLTTGVYRYGFYGNVSSGSNKWNLYMNGTADNYLNGNLGIGVTNPSVKLDVVGAINARSNYISSTIPATGDGIFVQGFATYGEIKTNNNGHYMSFVTGTTERMRLTATNGNLHIGTFVSDSGEKLQVNGTMKVTGASTFGGQITVTNNIRLDASANNWAYYINGGAGGWGRGYRFMGNAGTAFGGLWANGSDDTTNYYTIGSAYNAGLTVHHSSSNVTIGTTADTGEKLQVNGTMKVTGASTISGGDLSNVNLKLQSATYPILDLFVDNISVSARNWRIAGVYSNFGLFEILSSTTQGGSPTTTRFSISGITGAATFTGSLSASEKLILNGASAGTNTYNELNRNAITTESMFLWKTNSVVKWYLGQRNFNSEDGFSLFSSFASANVLYFAPTGAATFSSDLTVNGVYNVPSTSYFLGNVTNGYRFNNAANTVNLLVIADSGAANFTTSIQAGTAIAIGTTPDTNKPFKILKNINATVGINFENTSTGSSAFSAIQMGTDVTGGTKFTNLVYASSGVTANGVYQPDGTSLINNGGGGLNFLGTPTRFYTGGSNGVVRLYLDNNGLTQLTATTPTTNETDGYRQYSADVVAGNAAPHFRTENGAVIKIYQETTGVGNAIFSAGGGTGVLDDSTFDGYTLRQIVKALRNQGILA